MIKICGKDIAIEGKIVRIARLDGEHFTSLADPEATITALRETPERVDLFTFAQKVPDTNPKYKYHMELDNLAVLPISTFDHWWNSQIGFKARNKAKQAEKRGVVIREVPFDDALLQGICDIYNETPIRQGRRFPHYGMNADTARDYAGTFLDRSIFIGAFFEGKIIGFVKLVTDEDRTQASALHILSMIQHRDKAPTNALLSHAIRLCAERGISYMLYANFSYGKKLEDSLSKFKEHNAFTKVEVPRYYVPMTTVGKIALRLGLHHKLSERVPEPLAAKLRDLRRSWYDRKFQAQVALL